MQCNRLITASSLEEVSKACNAAIYCQSKLGGNGKYTIKVFEENPKCKSSDIDPRHVVVKMTNQAEKINDLGSLLKEVNFIDTVRDICKSRGKDPKNCSISIKVNIAPASQKQYHYYTDPKIADFVINQLKLQGFSKTMLVESETNAVLANPKLNPTDIGKALGYQNKVFDLTTDQHIPVMFKKGQINASKSMLSSDVIINIPKPKNHDLMKMTGSLKNMYGSIPDFNKYMLFHHKKSGLNVQEATVAINHTTPVDIIIADWVDSVDGNEVSYFNEELNTFDHFQSNRLVYGYDPLSVDKYIARKMGYQDKELPILVEEERFIGKKEFRPELVTGDNVEPIKEWKRISKGLNLKAKLQDHIPVNNKMVAWGINKYAFPILK